MATYAVGDVQGCFLTFQKLLAEIKFDAAVDKLMLLGDVINRGPLSLETLRFVKEHASSIHMVLGNHELYAIGLSLGAARANRTHTLQDIFAAPDRAELIEFLRAQPLLRRIDNAIFVHAGILPVVTIEHAITEANELSALLQSAKASKFLRRFYEKTPTAQKLNGSRKRRLRLALAYFTLLRMCENAGTMNHSYNGEPDKAPRGLRPWFHLRNDSNYTFYFGHWAALGFYKYHNYICLDSGCVWNNKLTAIRLSDHKIFQVTNIDKV